MEKRIRELTVEVDELPTELQFKKSRIERIEAAKAALEAEHLGKRQGSTQKDDDYPGLSSSDDGHSLGEPDEKRQYNFTDPDSRIMRDGSTKSFEQAYNAQVAVDCDSQVIVAAEVTQQAGDTNQLIPLIEQVEMNNCQVSIQPLPMRDISAMRMYGIARRALPNCFLRTGLGGIPKNHPRL